MGKGIYLSSVAASWQSYPVPEKREREVERWLDSLALQQPVKHTVEAVSLIPAQTLHKPLSLPLFDSATYCCLNLISRYLINQQTI